MKQFFLIVLALLTILIGVSILPDLFREIKAKRKINKNDALTLAGLMLAIIPFALLLPNASVEFTQKAYSIEEESTNTPDNTKRIIIQLKNRQLFPVTVEVDTSTNVTSGNAAEAEDFENISQLIRLHVFRPSTEITFQPLPDASYEGDEVVILRLSNPTNADLGSVSEVPITIKDNDPEPEIHFSAKEYQVTEPAAEQSVTTIDIPVTLTAASGFPVTVEYSTRLIQGNATPNVDYVDQVGVLTFAPGETEESIQIPILKDTLDEPEEKIEIVLRRAEGAKLGSGDILSTLLFIKDNDELPVLSFALDEFVVQESMETAVINLQLTPPSEQEISVNYVATYNGNQLVNSTLTFNGQDTTQSIPIPLSFQNTADEPNKTVQVTLQNLQNAKFATGDTLTTNLVVEDDDQPPTVQFANDAIQIVDEDEGVVQIDLTLSTLSGYVPEVHYLVNADTSTTVSDDFTLDTNQTIQFDGITENSLTLTLNDDTETEATESIILTLSDPIYATLGSPLIKVIQIRDDDGSCTPRPFVDKDNDGAVDTPINLRFNQSGLDLYPEPFSAANKSVDQDDIQCVLTILFAEDSTDKWYQVRLAESGDIGWIKSSTDVTELIVPVEIAFNGATAVHLESQPGSRKAEGALACEDARKGCGQAYVLGLTAQSTVNDLLWLQVILRNHDRGWIQASRFQGLDLPYLRENLPEINIQSE